MSEAPPVDDDEDICLFRDDDQEMDGKPALRLADRPRRTPWPELAEKLEELAAMARRGEIAGASYIIEMADGETGCRCFHDVGSNVKKMLGEIDVMKHAILRRHCESEE